MTLRTEQRRQAMALSAYLKTVPEAVLAAALSDLGVSTPEASTAKPRLCRYCGRTYPICRRLWADDHEFEAPPKEADGR